MVAFVVQERKGSKSVLELCVKAAAAALCPGVQHEAVPVQKEAAPEQRVNNNLLFAMGLNSAELGDQSSVVTWWSFSTGVQ